ncbi:MAG: efflux transporter outer membrane subunit [Pseudomonadota bacterium]
MTGARVMRTASLVATALAAGCAAGPAPRAPTLDRLAVPDSFVATVPEGEPAQDSRWWQGFGDPLLAVLVEEALAANTDIEGAGARVRQSRAVLAASRAGFWPSLDASASVARREAGATVAGTGGTLGTSTARTANVGLDAAYEVDLFGGTRRAVGAAGADAEARLATLRSTQLTVAAETALAYVDFRLAQRRLAIARAALGAQDGALEIAGWRVQAGLSGALDLEQARQLRAQTAASIPTLERAVATARNRLAALLSAAPDRMATRLSTLGEIPGAPLAKVGIPAEVLRRRPDVAAAERTLVAEIARVGVRRAELYPALRLSGAFGGSAPTFGGAADAAIGALPDGVTVPLFQGGRLRAAVELQQAAAAAALAGYRGAVYAALEETENALVAADAAGRRERELVTAESAARAAAELARRQYQTGLIDFRALLEAERTLLSSEDARASARAERAVAAVQLYKALGGGWEDAPEPATSSGATP